MNALHATRREKLTIIADREDAKSNTSTWKQQQKLQTEFEMFVRSMCFKNATKNTSYWLEIDIYIYRCNII